MTRIFKLKTAVSGVALRLPAWVYSRAGLKAAWKNEMAFRAQAVVIALMLPVGIWMGESVVKWALPVGSGMPVLITELLNSGIYRGRFSARYSA